MFCPPTPPTSCSRWTSQCFAISNVFWTLGRSVFVTFIVSGFEKTGAYPLSLDVMTSKILGDKPGAKPHGQRCKAMCINDSLIQASTEQTSAPKSEDDWVHGGCLMTSEEIATKVAEKETKKMEREAEFKVNKKMLAQKYAATAHAKKKAQERRRETIERKLKSSEDTRKPIRRKRPILQNGEVIEEYFRLFFG
ncbi:hypothetical protein DYB31_007973 [Aphanomyces astaci]|uniref:Uncharacterized protein n=1 Tax=Aphanomyces astaci TaxID=112090 RepID=A0A397FCI3_APHAT|nr:hypothetical protein DYB31_007973 [Aphanomyces astaci]